MRRVEASPLRPEAEMSLDAEDEFDVPDLPRAHEPVVVGTPVPPGFAHPRSVVVLCRLESYRSGTPRLSKRDMKLRFATWQIWEFCGRSYARTARALSRWRGKPVSRQHVYYVIRRMRDEGILDGIR